MAAAPHVAYVGLGSNLGDRWAHLSSSLRALRAATGMVRVDASPVYESEAHVRPGDPPAPAYLNAVARVTTTRTPGALLTLLLRIERRLGRERPRPWAPRTLDLDLLLFGPRVLHTPTLTLPHPRLALRRFVLAPLHDLAPRLVVPSHEATVAALLAACPDGSAVTRCRSALQ